MRRIEHPIEQRFKLAVKVVVLDRAAYSRIVKAIPKSWVSDASVRTSRAGCCRVSGETVDD